MKAIVWWAVEESKKNAKAEVQRESSAKKSARPGTRSFLRMLWKFSSVYNVERQAGDHKRPVGMR
jgi:hypothetical protein